MRLQNIGTLRRVLRFIFSGPLCRQSLSVLALKYGTDKWAHGYLGYYESHFRSIRNRRLNILEIGVGGYDNPKEGGASLRMWKEYFPSEHDLFN